VTPRVFQIIYEVSWWGKLLSGRRGISRRCLSRRGLGAGYIRRFLTLLSCAGRKEDIQSAQANRNQPRSLHHILLLHPFGRDLPFRINIATDTNAPTDTTAKQKQHSASSSSASPSLANDPSLSLRQRHERLQSLPHPLDDERQVVGTLEEANLKYASYLVDVPPVESRPMGVKFRSFYPKYLEMYWADGSEQGVYTGAVKSGGFTATNTYEDHVFIFRTKAKKEIVRFTMKPSQHLYIIAPPEGATAPPGYADAVDESIFMQEFFNRTESPFLGYYPRAKPILHMWRAEHPGDVHHLQTTKGFYNCDPHLTNGCVPGSPLNLDIKVVSTKPRVLVIENVMSAFECNHIVGLGKEVVARSTVGDANTAFESNTRTSLNGWLARSKSTILNHMFSRFADVLGVSDEQLHHDRCAEELQVVRYTAGQEYTPHHDFGYSGKPNQRFLTLLMYIHSPTEGGATSFPKAFNGRGLKIAPPVGSAVLFYSMTPDGNSDDLSLHSGMPVRAGVKWVCNLWVWDPDKDTSE